MWGLRTCGAPWVEAGRCVPRTWAAVQEGTTEVFQDLLGQPRRYGNSLCETMRECVWPNEPKSTVVYPISHELPEPLLLAL